MKTIFLSLLVFLFCFPATGQDSLMVWRYAEIKCLVGAGKGAVEIDNGEVATGWFTKTQVLEDANGKAIKFKSPIDALNYMSINGWELVNTYTTDLTQTLATPIQYLHYVIRRKEQTAKK